MKSSSQSPHGLRFGIFEIDLDARELRKNGLIVKLQEQPFKILVAIVRRAGSIISREELYSELSSQSTYDFKHGLNNAIQKIREVLDDSPENSRFIKTVPGRGYRFLPQVEVVHEASPNGSSPRSSGEDAFSLTAAEIRRQLLSAISFRDLTELGHRIDALISQHPQHPNIFEAQLLRDQITRAAASDASLILPAPETGTAGTKQRKRWRLWVGSAVLLIGAALSGNFYLGRNSRPSGGKVMLVVVPFVNMSGDPGQEYFADGMTEEMITELGGLNPQHLGVIARTSSMQYKGAHKDAAQIGRELGVNYLLEGSVQREGDQVRVTAQLIQTSDQTHLWARSYDGDFGDLLKIESSIAHAIAGEIQITLSKQVQEHLAAADRVDPEAHLAYLQGLQALTRRSRDGQLAAIAYFKQSIAIDPSYAVAYAGLARAYTLAPVTGAATPAEAFPKATEAAAHALSLDSALAEAHSYLGFTKAHWEFDWPGAEREFRKALELDPSSATAHLYYSHSYLSPMGRHDEAIAEMKKAIELDPLNLSMQSFFGRIYVFARRYDEALAQFKRTEAMDPTTSIAHVRLAQLYAHLGKYQDAIAEEIKARANNNLDVEQASEHGRLLKQAFESGGPQGYWLKELEFASEKGNPPEAYATSFGRAIIWAELGDKNKALDWLEKAYAERDLFMTELSNTGEFDFLRQEPRFQTLLQRTGLGK